VYPYFMVRAGAMFFFTFGVVALLATFAQINPVWLDGPYSPASATAGSGPEFYLGMIEGAIRAMPNWHWDVFGYTFAFDVFVPAVLVPGLFFTAAAAWPFLEQWFTGDRALHHLAGRPRDAPARTGTGVAVITFYGILWAEGADDIIASYLHISLELITEIARYAVLAGPVAAYLVTNRICLGLQRRDLRVLEHGAETGIIRRLPSGAYVAETRPALADAGAVTSADDLQPGEPVGLERG
jgi:ubiquinol-cytochrome c reductase cytochrome b subunit